MYCKIKITCKICKCSTEIEADGFQPTGHFVCQNCGQIMPNSIHDGLATAMDALAKINEDTCQYGLEDETAKGFLLSVSGKVDTISPSQ